MTLASLLLGALAASGCGESNGPGLVVDRITVTPASASLDALGETVTLQASAFAADGTPIAVDTYAWSSSAQGVATVSAAGKVTATGNGSATVTATASGVSGSASITVEQVVASLTVFPDSVLLTSVGDTVVLASEARDANGNTMGCAPVTWTTSKAGVGSVSASGTVTAVDNGTATVTASCQGKTDTAKLVVEQAVASVTVSPASVTFDAIGDAAVLTAVASDANGNAVPDALFAWESQTPSIVTVDAGGTVTSVGAGSATVTATETGASVAGAALISVVQVVASIEVSLTSATLDALGATTTLHAQAKDGNGNPIDCAPVNWASLNEAVAVVDGTGTVTAVENGSATLTATCDGVTGSTSVAVSQVVTQLGFVVQPSDVTAGHLMAPAVQVHLFDSLGNLATNASDVVSLSLQNDPSGGLATLWGSEDRAATNGIARFDSLSVDLPGSGYSLLGSSAGSASASASFDVGSDFHDLAANPSATVLGTVSSCDNCSETLPGTFLQNFYGVWYTAPILVVSNGYLQAATGSASSQLGVVNRALPDTLAPRSIIAAYWDDLSPSVSGDVLYAPYADSSYSGVVVHWRNVQRYSDPGSSVSVQAIYRWRDTGCVVGDEPGCSEIQFVLGPRILGSTPDGSFVVGVQDSTGTVGYTVFNNESGVYREGLTITLSWDGQNYTRIR